MRFALDLIWVDEEGHALRVDRCQLLETEEIHVLLRHRQADALPLFGLLHGHRFTLEQLEARHAAHH
jgi:hypothetical protein